MGGVYRDRKKKQNTSAVLFDVKRKKKNKAAEKRSLIFTLWIIKKKETEGRFSFFIGDILVPAWDTNTRKMRTK